MAIYHLKFNVKEFQMTIDSIKKKKYVKADTFLKVFKKGVIKSHENSCKKLIL